MRRSAIRLVLILVVALVATGAAGQQTIAPRAFIDGAGPGWRTLGQTDFTNVNCDPETWSWKDGTTYCTGTPIGVMRTVKQYGNFEMVAEWQHLKSGGNSGIFVWASEEALTNLKPGTLPPGGIEVQEGVNFTVMLCEPPAGTVNGVEGPI